MNDNMLRELLGELKSHIQAADKLILIMEHKLRNIEHVMKLSQQISLQEDKLIDHTQTFEQKTIQTHLNALNNITTPAVGHTSQSTYPTYLDTIQQDFQDHSLIRHSIERAKLQSTKTMY